jgi:hypothetical protein
MTVAVFAARPDVIVGQLLGAALSDAVATRWGMRVPITRSILCHSADVGVPKRAHDGSDHLLHLVGLIVSLVAAAIWKIAATCASNSVSLRNAGSVVT